MAAETTIFIGVAIYMVMMIGIGLYASKKSHSVTDFMVAGRGLPTSLLTMTVIATWFGGSTIMGGAGAAYDEGMLGVIEDPWGGALAIILIGLFFVRTFHRLKIITVADFMEMRFGRIAGIAIMCVTIFANTVWVGSMLVAFGLIFFSLTGIPLQVGVIAGAIVIVFYTAVGGMWAVALTDFVQMCIVIVGVVTLFTVVLIDVGGWGAIAPQLGEHTFRMTPLENDSTTWLHYFRAWAIIGLVDITAQTLFQRASSAKSERVAQNSFYLGGLGYLVFGLVPVFIGIIASVSMPGLDPSESVIPTMMIEHLHPVAVAVALLSVASVLSRNLLPLVKKDPGERLSLNVARYSIPVIGLIAIVVALQFQSVFELMVDSNILGLAIILVPFVFGIWWRKANRTGALATMLVGTIVWLSTLAVAPELPADFIGFVAGLITMLVVTPLTQTFDPPRQLVDGDGNPIDTSDRLGTLPLFRKS